MRHADAFDIHVLQKQKKKNLKWIFRIFSHTGYLILMATFQAYTYQLFSFDVTNGGFQG